MSAPNVAGSPPGAVFRMSSAALLFGATALIAVIESFYVPLRVGTVRIPLSVGIALVCHPLLIRLMRAATGSLMAMLATFAIWLVIVVRFSIPRADGDLIITGNNWVATTVMFGGALLFVASIGLMLPLRPRAAGTALPVAPAGSLGGNGTSEPAAGGR
ncbi:MAG: hypothetical protein WCB04_03920 [Mycobacteriales bacterium]